MAHVFISYKQDNIVFARQLEGQLRKAGFEVWRDEQIPGEKKWLEEIELKIRSSLAVVVVITPASAASEWVNYEWIFARGAAVEIIPIYVASLHQFPYRLDDYRTIDFRQGYEWDKLSARLREIKNKDAGATKTSVQDVPPFVVQARASVESLDENERKKSVQRLKLSNHPATLEALEEFLDHHVIDVRIRSALVLSEKPDYQNEKVIAGLLEGLTYSGSDSETRQLSAKALQKAGKLSSDGLIKALESENTYARQMAAWSLGQIKDESAVQSLIQSLADDNFSVVTAAVEALGQIRDAAAIPALASILAPESQSNLKGLADVLGKPIGNWAASLDRWNYTHLCNAAAESLSQIGTEEALKVVKQWKSGSTSP